MKFLQDNHFKKISIISKNDVSAYKRVYFKVDKQIFESSKCFFFPSMFESL